MTLKIFSFSLIALSLTAFSSQEKLDEAKIWTATEKRIKESCIEQSGNTMLCACIQAETREKFKARDYHFILESIYHTERLDMDNLKATLAKYSINSETFRDLTTKLKVIEDAAEEHCEKAIEST